MNDDAGPSAILDEYARLAAQREALESEIGAIAEELTSGPTAPGLHGPLVDAEGFPRSDLDVYRVRHQRHAFACKQTDHRAVMRRIEELLPRVFEARAAMAAGGGTDKPEPREDRDAAPSMATPVVVTSASATTNSNSNSSSYGGDHGPRRSAPVVPMKPFAIVDSVQDGSPAATAGLCVGDRVVQFGTADASNHRELEAVKDIVLRNVGAAIPVRVHRPRTHPQTPPRHHDDAAELADLASVLELVLIPQRWGGPGVLGCLLLPVRDDDNQRP